jgi:hypothetical protein
LMSTGCQTSAAAHSDATQDSCCPKGQHISCCLDLCLSTIGTIASPMAALTGFDRQSEAVATKLAIFSSRGDSPLIRPPIL